MKTTITLPSGARVAHYREANGAIRAYVINSPAGEFSAEQYIEYQAWLDSRSRHSCEPADYLGEAAAELHADRIGVQDQAFNRYWTSTEEEG